MNINFSYIILLVFVILLFNTQSCIEPECKKCSGTGELKCLTCEASGKIDREVDCDGCERGYEMCSMCSGTGTLLCEICKGTAKTTQKCNVCGGLGIEYTSGIAQSCYQCFGKGVAELPCTNCGGNGSKKCSVCKGQGTRDCRTCNGMGFITGKIDCLTCSGLGKVICDLCKGEGK